MAGLVPVIRVLLFFLPPYPPRIRREREYLAFLSPSLSSPHPERKRIGEGKGVDARDKRDALPIRENRER
jgi:hypothetical protein